MSTEAFPKQYQSGDYEKDVYSRWEKSGALTPEFSESQDQYADILPPPNANGELHIGHASGYAVMDLLGRAARMQGKKTLLLPGKDHAGIQTQVVYEKKIKEERGVTRQDVGREKFYQEIYDFCIDRSAYMRSQEKRVGLAADWSREKFTLDPAISRVVQETFVRMFHDGLIYRGERIINWCPGCMTALSDLEVKYVKEKTKFYYFQYGPVVIGTARPETKFQDKIIVAHPNDKRYKKFFGKTITVPWITGDVQATFMADESVDPKFGTGAMTITPAHSFEDFAIAKKHNLPIVQIIDEQGNFTDAAGPEFVGKNARASREKIVEILDQKGLLVKVDDNYEHNLSVCERSDDPIEPLVSKQWFVNVDHKKFSLKKEAIRAVKTGKVKMYPERFADLFLAWMGDLYDWNISRQIWWGHRIPAYYCDACGSDKPIVSIDAPQTCPECGGVNIQQDSDTLDTWFSSGQWAYTTLGFSWDKTEQKNAEDFQTFFPSDLMVMGRDLVFFWNARMIMMSLYATRQVPYKRVYFTGLVRDKFGKKMSKSRGNGIDPLEMIEKYGADALRLAMLSNTSAGNDFRMFDEKIEGYRNFVNKLWNIARFVDGRKSSIVLDESKDVASKGAATTRSKMGLQGAEEYTLADRWILSRLQEVIEKNTKDLSLDRLEISMAANRLYEFLWGDFADWYLEMKKIEDADAKSPVLREVLVTTLKLLHPFIPFVTEVIWEKMGNTTLLMTEKWPTTNTKHKDADAETAVHGIQEVVAALRSVRADYHLAPKESLRVALPQKFDENISIIERLARAKVEPKKSLQSTISRAITGDKIFVDLAHLIDVPKEINNAEVEKKRLHGMVASLEKNLKNKNFIQRAPKEIVEQTEKKLETQRAKLVEITDRLKELSQLQ